MKRRLRFPGALVGIWLAGVSCQGRMTTSVAPASLTLTQLVAIDAQGQTRPTLDYDLCAQTPQGIIPSLLGQVSVSNGPGVVDANGVSLNDVRLTRYRVEYTRYDGRSTPLVDVPLAFEAGNEITIGAGETKTLQILLLRAVALTEPPLLQLAEGIGLKEIRGDIVVTFSGSEMSGHPVSVSGSTPFWFHCAKHPNAECGMRSAE
ncbi:MAG: hypothetical protein AB1714_18045 [Acidobacteriota bacterium]